MVEGVLGRVLSLDRRWDLACDRMLGRVKWISMHPSSTLNPKPSTLNPQPSNPIRYQASTTTAVYG